MKHLLIYPVRKPYLDPQLISEVAVKAEEAGFYAFLSWDHYLLPDAPDTLDAWQILGYLAAKTTTLRLGTVVTPFPFRPPAQLSKIVATVDHLSRGRTILGVGAGWHQPEFDAFSHWDSPGQRVAKTKEALELLTRLWTGKKINFNGQYFKSVQAQIAPPPIQQSGPPLWFGVRGPKMMELAAKYGSAWIPTNIKPDQYAIEINQLHARQRQLGSVSLLAGALQNFSTFTDTGACVDTILEYGESGCEFYGSVWSYPPKEMVSRIDWFASNVMPQTSS